MSNDNTVISPTLYEQISQRIEDVLRSEFNLRATSRIQIQREGHEEYASQNPTPKTRYIKREARFKIYGEFLRVELIDEFAELPADIRAESQRPNLFNRPYRR